MTMTRQDLIDFENSYDLIKPKVKRRKDSACHAHLLEED
jgi:hypothetical protein